MAAFGATKRTRADDLGRQGGRRFSKADFVYFPDEDVYRCPAGQKLVRHMETVEHGMTLHRYCDKARRMCLPALIRLAMETSIEPAPITMMTWLMIVMPPQRIARR